MSFYFPLGLLGLIGVPVLILIYIIKSKYTEQVIASTYLWELSEKFLKKRKPISKLTGIITLILQIIAVIVASLLIAHPVFTIPHSANDFYFVLDGSASMNMTARGESRFDRAKDEIIKIINSSRGGSTYTLVLAGDDTNVAFEFVDDKEQAKAYLGSLTAGWNTTDCSSAMVLVQDYFDKNPSAEVYFVTDKTYESSDNMQLINVAKGESNYAFTSYGYSKNPVTGEGSVISYDKDAQVTVEMWIENGDGESEKVAQSSVSLKAGESSAFKLESSITSFSSLELRISADDAFAQDNKVIFYDEDMRGNRKVLLINDNEARDGVYIKTALEQAANATVETAFSAEYEGEYDENSGTYSNKYSGYDMYVFNGFTPKNLPKNSSVWLINAIDGTGKGSGISFRDTAVPRDETGPNSYYTPKYGNDYKAKLLLEGVSKQDIAIRKYARLGVPANFTKLLTVGGEPVVFAGLNENNDRQVVFAFSIGDSNFGGLTDFAVLVRNLVNYSIPLAVDKTVYESGGIMNVNVMPGCEDIIVTTPSGKSMVLDIIDTDMCEVRLDETGTYTINVTAMGRVSRTHVYAGVPAEESNPLTVGGTLALSGEKQHNFSDGYYDELLAFFILILLLLIADWGIYCYEQYQLR